MCLNLIGREADFIYAGEAEINRVRYKLQSDFILNKMFIVDSSKFVLGFTSDGEIFHEQLKIKALDYIKKEDFNIKEAKIPYHALTTFYKNKIRNLENEDYSCIIKMLDHYCITRSPKPLDSLPEKFFPINEIIEEYFSQQQHDKIAELCDIQPNGCSLPTDNTPISEEDKVVIDRVLSTKSQDKTILFVGFNQTNPIEGSEILFNTPGYTRTLFWGNWDHRPDENHNTIKMGFSEIEKLLENYKELYGYFDYIIVGMETDAYVPLNVWIRFGDMLKKKGRLVCQGSSDYVTVHFWINKILNKSFQKNEMFNFYRCDDSNEEIFNEIRSLAFFDKKQHSNCYAKADVFLWHKKL